MSGSGVGELYRELKHSLETAPGPEDDAFWELWNLFLDVANLVSVRLLTNEFGGRAAAHRVQVFVAFAESMSKVCRDVPVRVPSPAMRSLRATARYLERTPHVEELSEYLELTAPVSADLSEYLVKQLGRYASPLVAELSLVGRAASLMSEGVVRTLPGL